MRAISLRMHRFRIATWNIRKAIGLDRRRDPDRVLSVIGAMGADIVVLQEADYRLGDRPSVFSPGKVEAQTGLHAVDAENGRSLGWHGNAILVPEAARGARIERIDLPGLEPRGALLAEFDMDGPLRIVGVHLGLMRRHRQEQLRALVDGIAARPDMPTVILGDMNEWSPTAGLEPLSETYEVHAPGRSYHAARPLAALDRIALSGGLRAERGGVLHTHLTRIASDHLPVWLDVSR